MSIVRPYEPDNKNQLRENKASLVINRLAGVSYFLSGAVIPGLQITHLDQPTPFYAKPIPSYKLQFDQSFSITFQVNQDLSNWEEIVKWMVSMAPSENGKQYADALAMSGGEFATQGDVTSDARLLLYTGQYETTHEFAFYDIFPISISQIQFNMGSSAPLTCDASFAYLSYKLNRMA